MKRRSFIVSLVMFLIFTTFTFTGCFLDDLSALLFGNHGGNAQDGGNNNDQQPPKDEEPPKEEEPLAGEVSLYFNGLKAEYNKSSFYNEKNMATTFKTLARNQVEVLSEDITYRLIYLYGGSFNLQQKWKAGGYMHYLKNNIDENYSYNGNDAIVLNDHLLTKNEATANDHYSINVNDISSIKFALLYSNPTSISAPTRLCFPGAIDGRFYKVDSYNYLAGDKDASKAWLKSFAHLGENYATDFENYCAEYGDDVKLALAQIMANQSVTGEEFTQGAFDNAINKIEKLGFNETQKQAVVNYINNYVIGSGLIAEDERLYQIYYKDNPRVDYNLSQYPDKNPYRHYKAYRVVIPAAINMALTNTFENTNTPLYSQFYSTALENSGLTFSNTAREYKNIVLKAKKDTPVTKLVTKLKGASNQTIILKVKVVTGGKEAIKEITHTLSSQGQELIINLNEFARGSKFNSAYNGEVTSYKGASPFTSNEQSRTNSNGSNYIEISFFDTYGNANNNSLSINFLSYYDKV